MRRPVASRTTGSRSRTARCCRHSLHSPVFRPAFLCTRLPAPADLSLKNMDLTALQVMFELLQNHCETEAGGRRRKGGRPRGLLREGWAAGSEGSGRADWAVGLPGGRSGWWVPLPRACPALPCASSLPSPLPLRRRLCLCLSPAYSLALALALAPSRPRPRAAGPAVPVRGARGLLRPLAGRQPLRESGAGGGSSWGIWPQRLAPGPGADTAAAGVVARPGTTAVGRTPKHRLGSRLSRLRSHRLLLHIDNIVLASNLPPACLALTTCRWTRSPRPRSTSCTPRTRTTTSKRCSTCT